MISFFMPTKVIYDTDTLNKNKELFSHFGQTALIVCGKQSAYQNGSFNDIKSILESLNINFFIFDQVTENPSLDLIDSATNQYKNNGIDFMIGIGGGSPIDAAKGIAVLLNNPTLSAKDMLNPNTFKSLPLIAIPTTAGTGTETTPYAIFTDHEHKTKLGFKSKVFPEYALLDIKYYKHMPERILKSTAIDALSHIIEGYFTTRANPLVDLLAEKAFETWAKIKCTLLHNNLSDKDYENLILTSTLAGMIISQTGTGLPHAFGYYLTYNQGILHGFATGTFLGELFSFHENKEKVRNTLDYLDFNSVAEFKTYLKDIIDPIEISSADADIYIQRAFANKEKLQNHPYEIKEQDIRQFFERCLKVV